ncbi:DDE-type integrase/transposase/recombinase [Prosthecochloris ethylica]|uniref:DDE-type integrase/transposase/recombinase n=1 Tax=Prosthecochloris ethylica TaxID=2743976 RepID=UPI003B830D14
MPGSGGFCQEFHVDQPNEVWTSDLTYVRTSAGWQYLMVILELFNPEIIGYSLSPRLTAESTVNVALDMAVLHRQPPAGVILRSVPENRVDLWHQIPESARTPPKPLCLH